MTFVSNTDFESSESSRDRLIVLARRQPRAVRIALIALPILALLALAYWFFGVGKQEAQAMPAAQVAVAAPLQRTIMEYDEFTGRFEASRTVEIRPRVSGQLAGIHFRDGDYVRAGQLLFTIDPRPFQAELAEARARATAARTQAQLTSVQVGRAQRLLAKGFVSRDDFDELQAADRSAAVEHRRARCGRPAARARPRVHARPCADQRQDFLSPARPRQPRRRRHRRRSHPADYDQRRRPCLFHLRRFRSASAKDPARPRGRSDRCRSRSRSGFRTSPITAGAARSISPTTASTPIRGRSAPGR